MDCVFDILRTNSIDPAAIERIDVHASVMTLKMDEVALPFVRHAKTLPVTLNFYTPYNLAVALMDKRLGPEQFSPERIADTRVWDLAKKVRVQHDIKYTTALVDNFTNLIDLRKVLKNLSVGVVRELLSHFGMASPFLLLGKSKEIGEVLREGQKALKKFVGGEEADQPVAESLMATGAEEFKMAIGARVQIRTTGGATYESEQEIPNGAAGWNLEEKRIAVIRKFEKESGAVLSSEAANRAFGRILSLDALDNQGLRELIADCTH